MMWVEASVVRVLVKGVRTGFVGLRLRQGRL